MIIDLIGLTRIDWPKYMGFCSEVYNTTPTRELDSSKLKFNEQLAFPLTLNELAGASVEPIKTIRNGGLYLETISAVFISKLEEGEVFPLFGCVDKFDLPNHGILLSGTIRQWKDTVVTNLSFKNDEHLMRRKFFGRILGIFEAHDFRLVWDNYAKERLSDSTIILKEK